MYRIDSVFRSAFFCGMIAQSEARRSDEDEFSISEINTTGFNRREIRERAERDTG